ncbi:hypothetical protein Q8A73_009368 [Channa argus]|nr:hypothetical protein Q8A73_009368 [Channa argus]
MDGLCDDGPPDISVQALRTSENLLHLTQSLLLTLSAADMDTSTLPETSVSNFITHVPHYGHILSAVTAVVLVVHVDPVSPRCCRQHLQSARSNRCQILT